jgi:murein DD-endopeptidase MepM/ murein hydrolase activator NlpD
MAAPAAVVAPVAVAPVTPAAVPVRPRVPPLWLPLAGAVVRGFDAPARPYGPGHRGIDVAASVGEVVRAPAAGTVVFAGPVAGTTWASIRVAPGVVVTVGPLQGEPVTEGQVRTGTAVGRVAPGHAPGSAGEPATLHLSLRVDGEYVDPLAYLIDRPRPRLAPLPTPGGLPAP